MKTNRAFCLLNAKPLAANRSFQFRRTHNGHLDLRNRTLAAADHTQRMGLITAWLFCGLGINESWERGWSSARADSRHRS